MLICAESYLAYILKSLKIYYNNSTESKEKKVFKDDFAGFTNARISLFLRPSS